MPRQIRNFFSLLRQCVGKKTAKNLAETFAYHVGSGFGIPRPFVNDYDSFFELLILLVLSILYCLLITHLNGRNRRQYFSLLITLFWFLCVSLLQQENTLSNARKTMCSKYNSVCKPKNVVIEKYKRGWRKKDKKIDWSLNEKVYQKSLYESNTAI